MQNIHVSRNIGAKSGHITPEDRSWQLAIDDDGIPHLWVRVSYDDADGQIRHGMVALDDFLEKETTVKGLMTDCIFGGHLSEEEEAAAYEEYKAQCAAGKRPPCPLPL